MIIQYKSIPCIKYSVQVMDCLSIVLVRYGLLAVFLPLACWLSSLHISQSQNIETKHCPTPGAAGLSSNPKTRSEIAFLKRN